MHTNNNMKNMQRIPARAYLYPFETGGRIPAAKTCVACKLTPARWDSLYCSDKCKREFLSFDKEVK
jgi:hypothetical protein